MTVLLAAVRLKEAIKWSEFQIKPRFPSVTQNQFNLIK